MTDREAWQIAVAVIYADGINLRGRGDMVCVTDVIEILNSHIESNSRIVPRDDRWVLERDKQESEETENAETASD